MFPFARDPFWGYPMFDNHSHVGQGLVSQAPGGALQLPGLEGAAPLKPARVDLSGLLAENERCRFIQSWWCFSWNDVNFVCCLAEVFFDSTENDIRFCSSFSFLLFFSFGFDLGVQRSSWSVPGSLIEPNNILLRLEWVHADLTSISTVVF